MSHCQNKTVIEQVFNGFQHQLFLVLWCATYITNICITASRQINALKRLAKFLNERSRILIYKSFISSNFNYCPVTWMFCGRKNVMKLEKLPQCRRRSRLCSSIAKYVLRRTSQSMSSHLQNTSWWPHQMKTSVSLGPCEGNLPVTGGFSSLRPVTQSFDVFFDQRMNKRLNKKLRCQWFETPSRSLWRHYNDRNDEQNDPMLIQMIWPYAATRSQWVI